MKSLNILFLTLLFLSSLPAMAADEALTRAQYMIRQMNAELNQLKSTNQGLLTDKTAQQVELKSLHKKYDKLQSSSEDNKKSLKGKVGEIKQQYKDEIYAHTETRKLLAEMTQEKNRLFKVATEQIQAIDLCVGNNKKFFDINQQLLSIYENKGVWDSVIQAEPFSKLSQVQVENLVDDYQYKLEDLRVEPNL